VRIAKERIQGRPASKSQGDEGQRGAITQPYTLLMAAWLG